MAIIKKTIVSGKDVEKLDLSFSHYEKLLGNSSDIKHQVTIEPSNSTPRYLSKRNKNIFPHKNLYVNVHSISKRNENIQPHKNLYINDHSFYKSQKAQNKIKLYKSQKEYKFPSTNNDKRKCDTSIQWKIIW